VLFVAEWDKRTVSPVSKVTVICPADVTASLKVTVMTIVDPSLYEPFAVEEEKLRTVGGVVSGATKLAPEQEEAEAAG
jgi:hypothetical protein